VELESQVRRATLQLTELTDQEKELQQAKVALESKLEQAQDRETKLSARADELEKETSQLKDTLATAESESNASMRELETSLASLRNELDHTAALKLEMENQAARLQEEKDRLNRDLEEITSHSTDEISVTVLRAEKAEQQVGSLEDQLATLKADSDRSLRDKDIAFASKDDELRAASDERKALERKYEEVVGEVEQLSTSLKTREAQAVAREEDLGTQIREAAARFKDLEKQLAAAKNDHSESSRSLEHGIEELETQIQTTKAQHAEAEARATRLADERDQLSRELATQAQYTAGREKAAVQRAEQAEAALTAAQNDLDSSRTEASGQAHHLELELAQVRAQLEKLSRAKKELEEREQALSKERQALQARLDSLEDESARREHERQDYVARHRAFRASIPGMLAMAFLLAVFAVTALPFGFFVALHGPASIGMFLEATPLQPKLQRGQTIAAGSFITTPFRRTLEMGVDGHLRLFQGLPHNPAKKVLWESPVGRNGKELPLGRRYQAVRMLNEDAIAVVVRQRVLNIRKIIWKMNVGDEDFPEALTPWMVSSNVSSTVNFPSWLGTLLGETVDWLDTSESLVLDVLMAPLTLPVRVMGLTMSPQASDAETRFVDLEDKEIPGEMDLPDLDDDTMSDSNEQQQPQQNQQRRDSKSTTTVPTGEGKHKKQGTHKDADRVSVTVASQ